ncbi:putative non-specific serine/threonine protein kinase [Gammaproteobacteria bacterium]
MNLVTRLSSFVLRQALSEGAGKAIDWIGNYCHDPTQDLPKAILEAHEQTWRMIELALVGESLTGQVRQWVARGRIKGALQPLETLIQEKAKSQPDFRRRCLLELRLARKEGVLTPEFGEAMARMDQGFTRLGSAEGLLEGAQRIISEMGAELGQAYPHLNALLAAPTSEGPVLVVAFGYFLRQSVESVPELIRDLDFQRLSQLWQRQGEGLAELRGLFLDQRQAFAEAFESLAEGQERAEALLQEILNRLPTDARRTSLMPGMSSVLRSADDVRFFREVERRLATLPEGPHSAILQDTLGRLGMAVGQFAAAQGHFTEAARIAPDQATQAEAHFHAYRAFLEQRDYPQALKALQAAVQLDTPRFEPFPFRKYPPQRILGAGGFGVAFLCHHSYLGHPVVIKTLHRQDLDRDVGELFREGQILNSLGHPAIIAVKDSDYADPDQTRPYLVMEHFDGESLTDYLKSHRILDVSDVLPLARQMASALLAAHQKDVLHRDIKPDNLLVRREGNGWVLKVPGIRVYLSHFGL